MSNQFSSLGLPPELSTSLLNACDQAADDTISSAEIANGAITAAKLATDAVTTAKILADNVTTAKIADLNVTTGKLALLAVDTAQLAANAVTTAKITNANVTKAKAAVFASAETTATGSAQNIAHGLGVTPALVLIVPTLHPGTPDTGAFTITEGSHGATNVVVTMTVNCKFKVFAWA